MKCVAAGVSGFEPDFLYPLENITVAQGRDATFTCVVNNLEGYRVSGDLAAARVCIYTTILMHPYDRNLTAHPSSGHIADTPPNALSTAPVLYQHDDAPCTALAPNSSLGTPPYYLNRTVYIPSLFDLKRSESLRTYKACIMSVYGCKSR